MSYPFSGILVRYSIRDEKKSTIDVREPAPVVGSNSSPLHVVDDSLSRDIGAMSGAGSCAAQPDSYKLYDQLHVNLWEVQENSAKKSTATLDLGVMIRDWQSVDAVLVDLPWIVKRDNISDLGSRLNSEKTIAAIFNEIVRYDSCADQSFARIHFRADDMVDPNKGPSNDAASFVLLRLAGTDYSIEIISLGHGAKSSQLKITLPSIDRLSDISSSPVYLRFRIDCIPRDVYSYVFEQADQNLLSSTHETRIIDFRINVRRGIPEEIFASNKIIRFPNFKKIHFFLTTNRGQVCDFESKNFIGCRSLIEEDVWNHYLNGPNSGIPPNYMKKFLGYQWTESVSRNGKNGSVKDLVVLGRFSIYRSTAWMALRYVMVGIYFGVIGNGLWDFLKPEVDKNESFVFFNYIKSVSERTIISSAIGIWFFFGVIVFIVLGRVIKYFKSSEGELGFFRGFINKLRS